MLKVKQSFKQEINGKKIVGLKYMRLLGIINKLIYFCQVCVKNLKYYVSVNFCIFSADGFNKFIFCSDSKEKEK